MMSSHGLVCAAALLTGQVDPASPAEVMQAVHADLSRIPLADRPRYRYAATYNLHAKQRAYFLPTFSGHCNKLSRLAVIEPVRAVSGGLWRINLDHYGWPAALWEKLTDPYFTEEGEEYLAEFGYTDALGRWVKTGTQKKNRRGFAPWLGDQTKLTDIYQWTGSYVPVVRADWFFNATAAAANRDPGYPEFLGYADEAGFAKLVGADEKKSRAFRVELREAVALSGVTLQPRAIVRDDTLGGARWKTIDFALAKGDKNPLEVLGRDIDKVKHDASEQFGTLPNNLWAVGAFDGDGKIPKDRAVPGNVAADHASRSNDRQIHIGVSCFRCHASAGLQDVDGWARATLRPPVRLNTTDYAKYLELREHYLRSLDDALTDDRARYERAIRKAAGLGSVEDARRYGQFWELYEDRRVDAITAARDAGVPLADFRMRLLAYLQRHEYDAARSLRLAAAALLHDDRALPVRQYEEAIPQLFRAVQP